MQKAVVTREGNTKCSASVGIGKYDGLALPEALLSLVQTRTISHDFVRQHCRSGHASTISSCQGRDTRHARWTRRHAYTALSRARAWEALSIED